jgi:serine/threonine protein kinase
MPAVFCLQELLKSLKHPNIVNMFGVSEDGERHTFYLIMEYCDLGDMRTYM